MVTFRVPPAFVRALAWTAACAFSGWHFQHGVLAIEAAPVPEEFQRFLSSSGSAAEWGAALEIACLAAQCAIKQLWSAAWVSPVSTFIVLYWMFETGKLLREGALFLKKMRSAVVRRVRELRRRK